MVEHFGLPVVQAYMGHVQDNAEESVRRVLGVLQPGSFTCPLDDGSRIVVTISIDQPTRSATVDFTGTSAQLVSRVSYAFPIIHTPPVFSTLQRTQMQMCRSYRGGCVYNRATLGVADEFQRTYSLLPGCRALRLQDARARGHSSQRWLPQAHPPDHPRGFHASPFLPSGSCGRKRRDVTEYRGYALRGARAARCVPRLDEQLHLR
jgi:hypothetical protein